MAANPVLTVEGLRKVYGDVVAVDNVSFALDEGICLGLLGPNGAGKSTTIEMLEGIVPPTRGRIAYRGQPVDGRFSHRVGVQFQHTALQDFLTVRDNLRLFASFYQRTADIDRLIEACALEPYLDRDARKLSGGQRQRVLLAIALINVPDILFLDEPTTGLDPQARQNFWSLIADIKARNTTILLTTHYMDEAYTLCDEIAIMDRGNILVRGQTDQLLADHFNEAVLELPATAVDGTARAALATRDVGTLSEVAGGGSVTLCTTDTERAVRALLDCRVPLQQLTVRKPTLEDLFIQLTGRDLRDGA